MRFKEKIGRQISEQLTGSDRKIAKYLEKENVVSVREGDIHRVGTLMFSYPSMRFIN